MKTLLASLLATLAIIPVSQAQLATPAAPARPKVVDTTPKAWQVGANAAQKDVSITFDQAMNPAYSAWIGRSSLVPELDLDSHVTPDRKTFSLKVNLQPGKVYVFALNEKKIPGVGFQTEKGISALPYFLVFQTAGNPAPDELPPRVVSTIPGNNAQQLDPNKLRLVMITFDRTMQTAKHGLHMKENSKEVDLAQAKFQYSPDGKSFTLAYEFKPSSSYEFELNSTEDIGFASAKRIPLWPLRMAFSTGPAR